MGSSDPILIALLGAFLALIGNLVVSVLNNRNSIAQDKRKAQSDLDQEKLKAKYDLILASIATNDPEVAKRNIEFFVGSRLLDDADGAIRAALARYSPVLPSPGGAPAPERAVPASDIAKLYNFPPHLDGAGQIVGLLEFAGDVDPKEIAANFAANHQPVPDVVAVPVGGVKKLPPDPSGQALADIQVVGGIAPKAQLRVYLTPFEAAGWIAALRQAVADGVGILLVNWGQYETEWNRNDLDAVNEELGRTARHGVTIVTSAGETGAKGRKGRRRDIAFPASSPWVLAVGGTAMESTDGGVASEVVWNEPKIGATGGGFSRIIERPAWQSGLATTSSRDKAFEGRAIPDVSAAAWRTMTVVGYGGKPTAIGGSSVAAGIWVGLIARINQGLGHNVGHVTPRLYEAIGPAGVLRPITKGDNSWGGVKGYSATDGWSPAAGWGAPDGAKLLEWLKANG